MHAGDFEDRVSGACRGDNLALLYQGMLAVAGRVRHGERGPSGEELMGDVRAFRQNVIRMREEVEKEALRRRYERQHVDDASYAVSTFIDECVQCSNEPGRNLWVPLHGEIVGKTVGGVDFFNRAASLLH